MKTTAERKPDAWFYRDERGDKRLGFRQPQHCNSRTPLYAETNHAIEALVGALRQCAAVCAGEVMDKNGLVFALEAARAALALWQPAAPDDSEARK